MSRFKSIGSVLILSVTLTVVLAIAGIILYISKSTYTLAISKEEQSLRQAGQAAQAGLDQFQGNAVSLVRTMASDSRVLAAFNGDAANAQARIQQMVKANSSVWSLLVFDAQGRVLAGANANGEDLSGGDRRDRDYYKAVMGGKDLVLPDTILVAKSGEGELHIFTAVQAVHDASGKVIGGIGSFVRWSTFTDKFIAPLHFGARGYGFMIDQAGRVIAHAADKSLMLKSVADSDFIKHALEKKNGELYYDWKGERKFLSFSTDPDTGFVVCMSAYESDLTATATEQRNMLIGIGLIALLAVSAIIVLLIRRLVVQPIHNLQHYANAVTNGDYKAARHSNYRFELANLADNLHRMVDQLKERLGFAQGVLEGFVLPCSVFDGNNRTSFINEHMLKAIEKDVIWGEPNRDTVSARAIKEGRTIRAEVPYPAKSGQKIFDVTSTPIKDLDGNVIGTLAVWFELTEIRAQQKKIEEQNERIAKAAAAANTVSDQVASASEELAAQIEQSSRGSEEQRSRTAEAATAMEEMNSTVMEVAKSASSAAELAERTKARAKHGSELVDTVVATINLVREQADILKADMGKLGEQAEGIGQIMNVISDIADQTNLLALNAAIEAARAGDAGRGFAVVADEVRKLAEKTMAATKQVGDSILAIQHSAQNNIKSTEHTAESIAKSTDMAQKSGEALSEIVDMVDQTADQVRGIATASEEQSAASEEISRSTEDINRIAGETSEAMIQSGQAVSDLARLAQELRTIINNMNG
jgi:methyl-accepting chemotaxis protein